MAVDVAAADGPLTQTEFGYLFSLASRLSLDKTYVGQIFQTMRAREEHSVPDTAMVEACRILGVTPSTPLSEVRRQYRSLMLRYHPDRVTGDERRKTEAHRRAQAINWAYDYLSGSRPA